MGGRTVATPVPVAFDTHVFVSIEHYCGTTAAITRGDGTIIIYCINTRHVSLTNTPRAIRNAGILMYHSDIIIVEDDGIMPSEPEHRRDKISRVTFLDLLHVYIELAASGAGSKGHTSHITRVILLLSSLYLSLYTHTVLPILQHDYCIIGLSLLMAGDDVLYCWRR